MDISAYNIAIVLGTRAELIKTFPVMLELAKKKIPYYFIHTGQHNLLNLCKKFNIKNPDIILSPEPTQGSRFNARKLKAIQWNLSLVLKIRSVLNSLPKLKYVIYHGDTMTTASAAIASSRLLNPLKKYKNVHLEAGLRSNDIFEPFPEEIARIIADRFSDILLVVSKRAESNVAKYKNSKRIINVGNTILDSALITYNLTKKKKIQPLSKDKFALISIHRHENINNKKRLGKILNIISQLKIKSFFTLHSNTKAKLIEFNLYEKLKENKNMTLLEPLDYPEYIYQISRCSLIICDGGSLQEESLIFKKPCIILRKATERQEGPESNFQFLAKLDVVSALNKINEYTSSKFKIKNFKNPYGKAPVSKGILSILK